MALEFVASPFGTMAVVGSPTHLERILFPHEVDTSQQRDSNGVVAKAAAQLDEYFAGSRKTFSLPLDPRGTAFQLSVWEGLLDFPFGATTTYGALAAVINKPRSVRAVGQALGRNPLPIVIPCHRVLSASGEGGFSAGLAIKRVLLDLESSESFSR